MAGKNVRISRLDLQIAWTAAVEARQNGRGGVRRAAAAHGVPPSTVVEPIDRVQRSPGPRVQFFVEVDGRRTGQITLAGEKFRKEAESALASWSDLRARLAKPPTCVRPR